MFVTGFFRLAEAGPDPDLRQAWLALLTAPPGLWVLALVCGVLFLIWIADAAVLYGFIAGSGSAAALPGWLPELPRRLLHFEFWAALVGAGLAAMIFAVSAFSVPLLHHRQIELAAAVQASAQSG